MPPSTIVAGRYRLVERIGQGAMGAVWRAHDATLDREVAVKEVLLPPGVDAEAAARHHRRTLREARSAARLDHPGIVTVHDVVEEDGRPWIVMRLVRAPSLREVLRRGGPLPPGRVAAIGLQLVDALAAAHAAGVLHRDVKPGNVLLTGSQAVLTDFGIAAIDGESSLTGDALLGSPAYMAPERARREPAEEAADLWSLGATLYAAVEGRGPYDREDVWGVMGALMSSQEPDPPYRAGPLTPVLAGLLQKDPARRMTADQARTALRRVPLETGPGPDTAEFVGRDATLTTADLKIPPPALPPDADTVPPPPVRRQRRQRVWLVLPAGLGVLVLAAALVVALNWPSGHGTLGQSAPTGSHGATTGAQPPAPGATPPGTTPSGAPSGFRPYDGSAFDADIPSGWTVSGSGTDMTFTAPGNVVEGISIVRLNGSTSDPSGAMAGVSRSLAASFQDYRQVGAIKQLPDYMGGAAELEFTFTRNGTPGHAIARVFPFGGNLTLAVVTSSQDRWTDALDRWSVFLGSLTAK